MWRALRWKVTGNSQIPPDKYPIFLGYSWVKLDVFFLNLVFKLPAELHRCF